MTSNNQQGIAGNRYRQLRVTITHELSGRASYRVYAKGLNDTWKEHHCIAMGRSDSFAPILSTEDAIAALIDLLKKEMLPGVG